MKYQEKPIYVTAFNFVSVGPVDNEGNLVADGNGNVVVQAREGVSAETIPFTFAMDAVEGFGEGDFVQCDDDCTNSSLVKQSDFVAKYVVA